MHRKKEKITENPILTWFDSHFKYFQHIMKIFLTSLQVFFIRYIFLTQNCFKKHTKLGLFEYENGIVLYLIFNMMPSLHIFNLNFYHTFLSSFHRFQQSSFLPSLFFFGLIYQFPSLRWLHRV